MRFAEDASEELRRFRIQRFCLRELSLQVHHHREIVEVHRDLRMVSSEGIAIYIEGPAIESFRFGEVAAIRV